MRRYRALLALVVLLVSLRWLPSGWCGREADALWSDDLETQRQLAAGADRSCETPLGPERFMTDSERFDGEWLFGTYLMAALGHIQVARAHPEQAEEHLQAADRCIDSILDPRVRSFDRAAWGSDPLDDLGTPRAHAAYLGYLNLVLSARRTFSRPSPHAQLNDSISAHLDARLRQSPASLLETYPGEVYPVDNTAVIASLAVHERACSIEHRAVLEAWDWRFQRLRDENTGLLVQAVTYDGEQVVDGPRGSGTGLAAYFLSFSHPEQSRALYESARAQLRRSLLGFSAMREYPQGESGRGDIDSGPVIAGLSISSTGFALAGSRAHGDEDTFASLWATAYLFGAPVDCDGARNFAFGGPLGDAMMFALLTARPTSEWGVNA